MNAATNPYSPPGASLPPVPGHHLTGRRVAAWFASPFLAMGMLGILTFRETNVGADLLVVTGMFLLAAVGIYACGWWWAVKARPGPRRFAMTALAMGIATTAGPICVGLVVMSTMRGFVIPNWHLLGVMLAVVIPIGVAWTALLGAAVRWRVRIMARRAAP